MSEEELKKLQARLSDLEKGITDRDVRIKLLEGQTATVALSAVVGLTANAPDAEVRTAVSGLVGFRRQVLEVLGKADEATAIGALTALKEKAGEAAALTAKIAEIETTALSAEWKTYLDGLSTAGQGGKFLEPAKRTKAESMAITIGGGSLTRKGIDGAKEYVVEMLSARTGGSFTPAGGLMGLTVAQADVNARMGIDNKKFLEAQASQLSGGSR